jgi:hypothetical protein
MPWCDVQRDMPLPIADHENFQSIVSGRDTPQRESPCNVKVSTSDYRILSTGRRIVRFAHEDDQGVHNRSVRTTVEHQPDDVARPHRIEELRYRGGQTRCWSSSAVRGSSSDRESS